MADLAQYESIIDRLPDARIAVIGDFVADIFLYGMTKRISREAPVLVLEYQGEKLFLGGAANAVHNLRAVGATPVPVGLVGADDQGKRLVEAFQSMGIGTENVLIDPSRLTTTKQRVVGSGLHTTFQQIVRIDRGATDPAGSELERKFILLLDSLAGRADVLIVSDYGYGVVTDSVIEAINRLAESGRMRVFVDSRYRLNQFRHAFAVTPNEPEAETATGMTIRNEDDVRSAGRKILADTLSANTLITRGKRGMALFQADGGETFIPIFGSDEIADVTGAGDTVIAVFAACCAVGANVREAAQIANVAGGLVVMKSGTATVSREEILDAVRREESWPSS